MGFLCAYRPEPTLHIFLRQTEHHLVRGHLFGDRRSLVALGILQPIFDRPFTDHSSLMSLLFHYFVYNELFHGRQSSRCYLHHYCAALLSYLSTCYMNHTVFYAFDFKLKCVYIIYITRVCDVCISLKLKLLTQPLGSCKFK